MKQKYIHSMHSPIVLYMQKLTSSIKQTSHLKTTIIPTKPPPCMFKLNTEFLSLHYITTLFINQSCIMQSTLCGEPVVNQYFMRMLVLTKSAVKSKGIDIYN